MDTPDPSTRLDDEISLLTAMYPDQATYTPSSRELKYTSPAGILVLRLPPNYPSSPSLPDVISAVDTTKNDLRTQTTAAVHALALPAGEEALDAIISAFDSVAESSPSISPTTAAAAAQETPAPDADAKKTVIIWLHHLLNTNKRKLALAPGPDVAGLSKPGYPGVLVYSGPAAGVAQHVDALRSQNWAAFQVRYDEAGEWRFAHGRGVREVESMAEVVKGVEVEGRQTQRGEFLRAVGIK
jgi:hypothetical protein